MVRRNIIVYLDNLITFFIFVIAGLTPLIFLDLTTEFFEMPKLIFLIFSTVILLGLWIFSWILKGKVVITRTPLDVPLLILGVAIIVSAYFSESKYAGIYGNFPRVHGSAVAWLTYILLYFVTVSHLTSIKRVGALIYVLFGSGSAVALISLLSFFGVFLPFDFARIVNFTPTGTSFSTVAFLLLLLPLPLMSILGATKFLPIPVSVVLSILFSATIVLIGSVPSYVLLVIVYAACLLVTNQYRIRKALMMFLVPVVATLFVFALAYFPIPGGLNKIQQFSVAFPREIQLPLGISWKVSVSAFRDSPFVGSGPATYLFNFTNYKPLEYNELPYWNIAFDTAYNEYLQILGTLGSFGLVAIIIVTFMILGVSRRGLSISAHAGNNEDVKDRDIVKALGISGLMVIMLMAIHTTTLVSVVTSLIILAVMMASQKSIRERVMELSLGLRASTSDNKQFDLLPIIILIIFIVGAAPLMIKVVTTAQADYYHRLALQQASVNGTLTYEYLQMAERLNPEIDLYRVDMAQTNFALANALAIQKGPTEENPEGTLTDEDRSTIQTLLSQAIVEARVAVTLNPLSARNWEVLASIYRNIAGVAENALAFSLDAYGRAIQRDPLNPALRMNVGGVYYSIGNYDLAIRFFSDAANIKPDYANAYFNLAVAFKDKGDLQSAQVVALRTVEILSKNRESNDYKIAVQFLEDLKTNAGLAGQGAPAAETGSALQNPQLENDVELTDLDNPPAVTPAPTVRPNPAASLPTAQPTPGEQTLNEQSSVAQPTIAPLQ